MTITWITVCDTCKREGWDAAAQPQTDGEALAALIEAAARNCTHLRVRRHSCLMGCGRGCNVTIQARGKIGYTLGDFIPCPEAAEAIVAYARLHAESATGQVPYRQWPQEVKGHFITRHPPLPED
ncbi:Predicted metal-binding protein [Meinhardsimonia xiamenensis]|jgi:predicted metal-binding protein|uniref:Predicted metal-binding protein n=1 Tax=Meinhardsimonia xiamenensis TaxID=990712 RepID=A0A1G8XS95_9RHOB|nr:DUF1636 domain-containing protein [Meinhardsimonia xiamenensis]PRX37012.1 putative metal-binding protein [Meinhardsimonia xiamenensis]SDJ93044.1 Predicted metal-binding protein [Meinhardsimonia xiamenensis]